MKDLGFGGAATRAVGVTEWYVVAIGYVWPRYPTKLTSVGV